MLWRSRLGALDRVLIHVVHVRTEASPNGLRRASWSLNGSPVRQTPPAESERAMTEIIAGVEIPRSAAANEATHLISEATDTLLFDHSRRVFVFSSIHARALGLAADPELLYLAAMFHDSGLLTPFSDTEQRFEIDGADRAHRFLIEQGFSEHAADVVWKAIALHTTPGIPVRMGPEIAATHLGVLTDVVGFGLDKISQADVDEITSIHPRRDFEKGFLTAFHVGLKDRPDTTYGTVNADVLEHFDPEFRRVSMVERVTNSPWSGVSSHR
jgi:hypothetical protein